MIKIKYLGPISFLVLITTALALYVYESKLAFHGDFTQIHYYSYENKEECKKKGTFVSDTLQITIEGDSLKLIKDLEKKFYTCKAMYQLFYGSLIYITKENKTRRRLQWYEPFEEPSYTGPWVIKYKENRCTFFSGFADVDVGEVVLFEVANIKTDNKIGTISILIE